MPAEKVANDVALAARQYLDANVAVDRYLADQVLVPLALGPGGRFSTVPLSPHTQTNLSVIQKILELEGETCELAPGRWAVRLESLATIRN